MKRLILALLFVFSSSICLSADPVKLFGEFTYGAAQAEVEAKLRTNPTTKIGSYDYSILPEFEKGKLVAISLQGAFGKMSDYRDTVVAQQHTEMRAVLQKGYTKEISLFDTSVLSAWDQIRLNTPEGYTKYSFVYEKEGKRAKLGLTHGAYREFALGVDIVSVEHEKAKKEKTIKEDSGKF